ncbi:MAG TPA: HAD-IA family hydrolase [Burkholderiales bacterium]|jgi:phosphoglycolate phosphatase|nr:HAD-IA family hydrolase [Burkholderiales bacterium]
MRSKAVLFDLDGTLADTASDLGAALNHLRVREALPAMPLAEFRAHASSGARGLLKVGFGVLPEDSRYESMRNAFLDYYDAHICVDTRLFPGIAELLAALEQREIRWGVVTNKSSRFTPRVLAALDVGKRAACVVCGDSTPHLKPHPASLQLAALELQLEPAECIYVGDDFRDIQAARAAGMRSVAVEWGYSVSDQGGPRNWNADAVIAQPQDLIAFL